MIDPAGIPPPDAASRALRRVFLTLFLRGRSARGMQKEAAPKSVGRKLAGTLFFYFLFGVFALAFMKQPVFAMAASLHAMTFMFLGMFVASSAGEILFNKEEADILLHRPVTPKDLLHAKIRVLVEVSLWLAFAFNFIGLFAGMATPDGDWRFPIVHAVSLVLEALFCTSCVVLAYQLCLRWFGRERLEGLMTTAQIVMSICLVLSGQILPRVMFRIEKMTTTVVESWWSVLLPPAWYAGFDDALAGSMSAHSFMLAGIGVAAVALTCRLAFGKLAQDYQVGLQKLGETAAPKAGGSRLIDKLVSLPPLSWWLRNPVERASFVLTAAYLMRDRDVKLRIYPAIAPMLIIPFVFLLQERGREGAEISGFGSAFCSGYLGIIPMQALAILQFSQQWQASDIFRAAPMAGPARICHGARRAVLLILTLPMVTLFGLIVWFVHRDINQLLMLLPGIILLPVMAILPNLGGKCIPLSVPTEEAKSASRGMLMMGAVVGAIMLSGAASFCRSYGYFWPFIGIEAIFALGLYAALRYSITTSEWPSME